MRRYVLLCIVGLGMAASARADEVLKPASERFAAAATDEVPDFRRHVLPLLGRLGCNGRACHGSFQGQGGFRLSLFGYDFKADHEALRGGDEPRLYVDDPDESLILQKPTLLIDHEGGERMKADSWQYKLLRRWIEGGAKGLADDTPDLVRIEVSPQEIVFNQPGETTQLKVVAHWSDGSAEDVTAISRYRTNDESIAKIDEAGLVTALAKGDTHVVAFYDNGVAPVQALLPVSDRVGPKYPEVAAPTKIDELVVAKLSKLGIVPSELCTDAEFLRRASLDITGTLPTAEETERFLADTSQDKRSRKIDELIERPAYAAWWATKLCDITGNNTQSLMQAGPDGPTAAKQWYRWMYERVHDNMPYDDLVEGLVMATGREPGQSYDEYCAEMSSLYQGQDGLEKFAERETMPHYWMRRTVRKPEDMALGFSYTFLGIQLQCAQCHKHPFDQWTKQDFDQFAGFFSRVRFGVAPDAKERNQEMTADLGLNGKNNNVRKQLAELLKEGKVVPFQEVFVAPARAIAKNRNQGKNKGKDKKYNGPPAQTARLLDGETLDLTKYDDPRQALMDWLRKEPGRYFARSFVNRVWAGYFNVGIIQPTDELNLANPPSNPALLDYLTQGFIEHGYDMKWLHREIAGSRTYQLSWVPNETNRLDLRNFSHAIPRRLPAEVAYDAIVQATAGNEQIAQMEQYPQARAIGGGADVSAYKAGNRANNYVLTVFGKPARATNCDCERSTEPSLLQTIYLRNDQETLALIDRNGGWLRETARQLGKPLPPQGEANAASSPEIKRLERRLKQLRESGKQDEIARVQRRLRKLREESRTDSMAVDKPTEQQRQVATDGQEKVDAAVIDEILRQAYLRTLNRQPSTDELARTRQHIAQTDDKSVAVLDVLWALLNTKEFIVNH